VGDISFSRPAILEKRGRGLAEKHLKR